MKRNKVADSKVWVKIDDELDSSLVLDADDSFKSSPIYHRILSRKNESERLDVCVEGEIIDCGII